MASSGDESTTKTVEESSFMMDRKCHAGWDRVIIHFRDTLVLFRDLSLRYIDGYLICNRFCYLSRGWLDIPEEVSRVRNFSIRLLMFNTVTT